HLIVEAAMHEAGLVLRHRRHRFCNRDDFRDGPCFALARVLEPSRGLQERRAALVTDDDHEMAVAPRHAVYVGDAWMDEAEPRQRVLLDLGEPLAVVVLEHVRCAQHAVGADEPELALIGHADALEELHHRPRFSICYVWRMRTVLLLALLAACSTPKSQSTKELS